LAHLNTPALMANGESVLTSGDDGIFPRGIVVGQAGIAPDQQWRVRLASNSAPIDFVRVIPPSNFPPPLDPVTPPPLDAPPMAAVPSVASLGAILPLAPGAAAVPTSATPQAIAAAQTDLARKVAAQAQQTQALNKKLLSERDAAVDAARRAEAARAAAVRQAAAVTARTSSNSRTSAPAIARPKTSDANDVPVAPSALTAPEAPSQPKAAPVPAPSVEGPTK
jgi:rod shape-determining protein MreC